MKLQPSTLGGDFGKTLCLYTRNAAPIVLTHPGAKAGSQHKSGTTCAHMTSSSCQSSGLPGLICRSRRGRLCSPCFMVG
eukprot:7015782-Prymnesium_polylepis.1